MLMKAFGFNDKTNSTVSPILDKLGDGADDDELDKAGAITLLRRNMQHLVSSFSPGQMRQIRCGTV